MITLITEFDFHTYNELSGEEICEGELLLSPDHQLGAYWVHEDFLRFAISSKTDRGPVISIQELQPTSDPPLFEVESFSVPQQSGRFSFSPVSFHGSFVSEVEVVIINVRDEDFLLQIKAAQLLYTPPGHFSPDGHLFACGTLQKAVYIWENTPAGYLAWRILRPRLAFDGFLFSPTGVSILSWGPGGVQLLHSDSPDNSPSPNKVESYHQNRNHLVACSAGGTCIATGRQGDTIITVLNLLGTVQQSINTNVQIRDIKIVDDTIFVTDGRKLVSWHFDTQERGGSTHTTRRKNEALRVHVGTEPFALSNDCSQIAFTLKGTVFLYDVGPRRVIGNFITSGSVIDIQFSPDGYQLWFIVNPSSGDTPISYHVELVRGRDSCFANATTRPLESGWSWDSLFRSPHECRIIGSWSEWVSDPRGNVLWLPPSWRTTYGLEARWNGKLLALVDGHHPEPIIIEFQP